MILNPGKVEKLKVGAVFLDLPDRTANLAQPEQILAGLAESKSW